MKKDTESMWRGTTTESVIKEEKNISKISDKQRKRFNNQIEKWKNKSNNVRFDEVYHILEALGFKLNKKTRGSHRVLTHEDTKEEITIPRGKGGEVGFRQTKEIIKIIEKYINIK